MYIGVDRLSAIFAPVCLSPKMVGKLANKMSTYYDNFKITNKYNVINDTEKPVDLSNDAVVFFAKSKSELKLGLASGPDATFTTPSQVVLFSGAYDTGKSSSITMVKNFRNLLVLNSRTIKAAKGGEVASLAGYSHQQTIAKLKNKGYFLSVLSKEAVVSANMTTPNRGLECMMGGRFTPKDIAAMLNQGQAVAPDTTDNNDKGFSKINWFFMEQRMKKDRSGAQFDEWLELPNRDRLSDVGGDE